LFWAVHALLALQASTKQTRVIKRDVFSVRVANTQTASPMSGVCYVQPTPTLQLQAQVQAWLAFRAP